MNPIDLIRRRSQPLAPKPTGATPQFAPLEGIRAVLFDVYGTLLISASGDISLTSGASRGAAIGEALAEVGLSFSGPGDQAVGRLHAVIARHHSEAGVKYPEVEIHEVWRDALAEFAAAGWVAGATETGLPGTESLGKVDVDRLAIEYEIRGNPVWPMPGVLETLAAIREAGLLLGIVSNAQSFTKTLFPALLDADPAALGFAPDCCIWSYEHRRAKPDVYLYEQAAAALAKRGIAPGDVLYVGNDMRNDVAPAAEVGFRTVLFAGDARSLRRREGDPLVGGAVADRTVTDFPQILAILRLCGA